MSGQPSASNMTQEVLWFYNAYECVLNKNIYTQNTEKAEKWMVVKMC